MAFREFGTTIGTQVNKRAGEQWKERVHELHEFWDSRLHTRDRDITPVMYVLCSVGNRLRLVYTGTAHR